MHGRSSFGAFLLILGLGSMALSKPATAPPARDVDSGRIGVLIEQLGSAKFQERSAAQRELEAIGAPALEQLKKSMASADLETSKRARELVRRIEERIFTASLLAPKRVHLKVTDMPVLDAVSELAKLSGYPIGVVGDRTKVAGKKITLDTGDVTFWEAFDKLCIQAGLIERVETSPPVVRFNDLLPGGGPPPQFLPVPPPPKPRPAPELKPDLKKVDNIQGNGNIAPAQIAGAGKADVAFPAALAQLLVAAAQVQPPPRPPAIQFQLQNQLAEIDQTLANTLAGRSGIILVPGTPKNQHVSYAGSVRSRVYPLPVAKAGEYRLTLEASAEPRLQGFTIVGTPTIEKAVDDQEQKLLPDPEVIQQNSPPARAGARPARILLLREMAMPATPVQRQVTLRFKAGDRPAKSLKELRGSFTAQVIAAPEALITMDNVLKAAGESAHGKSGGLLRLNGIDKLASGDYKVQVYLESPPTPNTVAGMIMGNGVIQVQQVQIQVGAFGGPALPANTHGLPELLDAKGNKFQAIQVPVRRVHFNNGAQTQETTIIFRGKNGHGEPERLVVHGSRAVNVTIPFAFQNVPLE